MFYPAEPKRSLEYPEHTRSTERVHQGAAEAHHDGPLSAVVVVELQQIFEWKIADDVRVEDEERLVVDLQQLSSQRQRTRYTHTHTQTDTHKQTDTHTQLLPISNDLLLAAL